MAPIRTAFLILVPLLLASCAAPRVADPGYQLPDVAASRSHADLCADNLAGASAPGYAALNSADIEILNWNIQKGGDPQWQADLASIVDKPDLLLFQEAALRTGEWEDLAARLHTSFAPGYRTRQSLTGVMTVSAAQPLTQCNLVSHEPWLRSPKATMISEYALTETDETLLVVNVHSVNFSFGVRDFANQISEIELVVKKHSGPVLLSGDFNTWRGRRAEIVRQAADGLGLTKLDYDVDHRKRVFGQALDHIYVRGLEVVNATTREVRSSDHNPMSVRLRL